MDKPEAVAPSAMANPPPIKSTRPQGTPLSTASHVRHPAEGAVSSLLPGSVGEEGGWKKLDIQNKDGRELRGEGRYRGLFSHIYLLGYTTHTIISRDPTHHCRRAISYRVC